MAPNNPPIYEIGELNLCDKPMDIFGYERQPPVLSEEEAAKLLDYPDAEALKWAAEAGTKYLRDQLDKVWHEDPEISNTPIYSVKLGCKDTRPQTTDYGCLSSDNPDGLPE